MQQDAQIQYNNTHCLTCSVNVAFPRNLTVTREFVQLKQQNYINFNNITRIILFHFTFQPLIILLFLLRTSLIYISRFYYERRSVRMLAVVGYPNKITFILLNKDNIWNFLLPDPHIQYIIIQSFMIPRNSYSWYSVASTERPPHVGEVSANYWG
jgi:hypothetical protein